MQLGSWGGDYGDFETTLGEREAREPCSGVCFCNTVAKARERGWRRGVLRGYDEETYAVGSTRKAETETSHSGPRAKSAEAMRGQSKEWAQARCPGAQVAAKRRPGGQAARPLLERIF